MPDTSDAMDTTTTATTTGNSDPVVYHGPQPIEIAFSFDTTGSMSSYLDEVRNKLQEMIQRLFMDIPSLKIAVFAHGDYCDRNTTYVTKHIDFTNDVTQLCKFVKEAGPTSGGDGPECYELVLHEVRTKLNWTPGTQRSLVMIGDDEPHGPNYLDNKKKIGIVWRKEVEALRDDMGLRVYAVQAGNDKKATTSFWKPLAEMTRGKRLTLQELPTITDMMMAICYREHGAEFLDAYEKEVRTRDGPAMRAELGHMFDALRDGEDASVMTTKSLRSAKSKKPVVKKTATVKTKAAAKKMKKTAGSTCLKVRVTPKTLSRVAGKTSMKRVTEKITKSVPKMHLHREKVRETRFALRDMRWSGWQLAAAPKRPQGQQTNWAAPKDGTCGVRRVGLFQNRFDKAAVYEFSVQPRASCRMYVMGCRWTGGFCGTQWETHLCQNTFKVNIDHAVKNGCNVFVRRLLVQKPVKCEGTELKTSKDVAVYLKSQYDYAWHMTRRGKWFYTRQVNWRHLALSCGY